MNINLFAKEETISIIKSYTRVCTGMLLNIDGRIKGGRLWTKRGYSEKYCGEKATWPHEIKGFWNKTVTIKVSKGK